MDVQYNSRLHRRDNNLPNEKERQEKVRKCRYCPNLAEKGRLCYPHYLAVNHKTITVIKQTREPEN